VWRRLDDADHALEQRAPTVEGAVGPGAPADRDERVRLAVADRKPCLAFDVELDHPGELLELDALQGVDVGLGAPVGRHTLRQRPCGIEPGSCGAAGGAADHLEEVTEQPGKRVVRVLGIHRHSRMLGVYVRTII